MIYRALGLMSGSSLDGLDIAFVEFQEQGGKWTFEILKADCYPYTDDWVLKLKEAINLSAREYQLLHADYGHYIGQQVNKFIEEHGLHYKIAVIASHGHTTFHIPHKKMTAQLGDGASIAAETQLPIVTDLRAMDVAFGGQGAPIVPIGEKMLFNDVDLFLNLGGIANISLKADKYIAFDVCPANRVLNMLANDAGKEFDDGGSMAESGVVNNDLLEQLNQLEFYKRTHPKSLANDFGTDTIYPIIKKTDISNVDALRTYTEHIVLQIKKSIESLIRNKPTATNFKLLCTGGGTLNKFLLNILKEKLKEFNIEVAVPDKDLINYKEALIMAFIGVLRWRQEFNVLSSVTGASRDSIGGALWIGQEA